MQEPKVRAGSSYPTQTNRQHFHSLCVLMDGPVPCASDFESTGAMCWPTLDNALDEDTVAGMYPHAGLTREENVFMLIRRLSSHDPGVPGPQGAFVAGKPARAAGEGACGRSNLSTPSRPCL